MKNIFAPPILARNATLCKVIDHGAAAWGETAAFLIK
jgi:hypothetical protein